MAPTLDGITLAGITYAIAGLYAFHVLFALLLFFNAAPKKPCRNVEEITELEDATIDAYLAWNKVFTEYKDNYEAAVLEAAKGKAEYFLLRLRILELTNQSNAN